MEYPIDRTGHTCQISRKVTCCSAVPEAFGNYTSGMYILSASQAVTDESEVSEPAHSQGKQVAAEVEALKYLSFVEHRYCQNLAQN